MANLARKTKRYPSDLTDEEWARLEPLMPAASRRGRKPSVDLREVLNAIRYLARSGGGWRMLPVHFGPWQTIYWWFRRFVRRLLFRTIHDVALMLDREAAGREASPSGGVLDSQTVKAPCAEVRGYDGGKRIVGRKRHIAVDTDGRLLMVNLTPANMSDSAGAQTILAAIRKRWPWLKHLFADAGYDRTKLMDKAACLDFVTRDRPPLRPDGLPRPAPALGGRAHLRLDGPLAPPRARLRTPPRCVRSHDSHRHGRPPSPPRRPSLISQTVTELDFGHQVAWQMA
jgi:transposase